MNKYVIMPLISKYFFSAILKVSTYCFFYFVAFGCSKKIEVTVGSNANVVIPISGNQKRLLALGDSYTIGQSVSATDRFPNQTINALAALGVRLQFPADIIAQTGWTTHNLLNGIVSANPQPVGPYDLVTLLIGVNNQYQQGDTAIYRIEFTQCLQKAIEFAGNKKQHVFVLSIPDYGATPFGAGNAAQIGLEIDRFNAINKQVCLQMNISYTDITTSTRMASSNPSLVAADGLHPSAIEYAKWATLLKDKMLPFVQ